ncbi:alpha/beta hydrolase [Sphingosinicella sp. CPCC 101087]|uniref:alpha/beta hydrolase n=1 Tax=Sphingosinicella sp. CPCC 101087 TaxID=2497754 RepID=UPI001FB152FD|nr:alpha/beta hydrolase [Sphingosinicella sp. CPCC 101087]
MYFTIEAAADGWPLRRFAFAPDSPPRGSLLFLGGRGDFVEKYLEAIGHWRSTGWKVDGFDWRGQGGSGRMLPDPMICHLESFDPLLDDLMGFVTEWKARTPGPHVAVAHSMGAHLLLRLFAERHVRLEAAVLMAPMAGIRAGPIPPAALGLAARAAAAVRLAERPLWRGDIGNVGGRMTSCPDRQADKIWWKSSCPDIASGPPSWGWLDAALRSVGKLNAARLERIDLPLMIMASSRDPVIDPRALVRLAARLPGAELRLLDGKGHELLREADELRLPVLAAIDLFFDRLAG